MDGPCDACAAGPAPLIDPHLSFSERFSETEWGAPVVPVAEMTFDVPRKTRKWSGVAMALVFGVLVVAMLIATLMLGTAGTRHRTADTGGDPSSLAPSSSPAASAIASPATSPGASPLGVAKPKPGVELRDAFLARLDQANLGMHTDFTMHLRTKGRTLTMTGALDIAPPDESATVRIAGAPVAVGAPSPTIAELIVKDGVQYSRTDGKSWQRSSSQVPVPSSPLPARADLSGLQYIGSRQVDGRKLQLYRATGATLVEDGMLRGGYLGKVQLKDVRFDILVTADGVPVTVSGTVAMVIDQGATKLDATLDFEFRVSHFGEPIQIQAPMTGPVTNG